MEVVSSTGMWLFYARVNSRFNEELFSCVLLFY